MSEKLDANRPVEVELVENKKIQPWTATCPHCKSGIYSDVPQINIICPNCGAALTRKDFENKVWAKK